MQDKDTTSRSVCSIPGCNRPVYAHALCSRDYQYTRTHGGALPNRTPKPSLPGEEWRPVVGFEGLYEVSDLGRVRRAVTRHILKPFPHYLTGYAFVGLANGHGKTISKAVHRLVGTAFLGELLQGMHTNHKDGDKSNNRVSNLEYVTPSVNMRHALATGLHVQPTGARPAISGSNNPASKLNESQVAEILAIGRTIPRTELARRYGVNDRNISAILCGHAWKHVPRP